MAITKKILETRNQSIRKIVVLSVLFTLIQLGSPLFQQTLVEHSYQLELNSEAVYAIQNRLVWLERLLFNDEKDAYNLTEPKLRTIRSQLSVDQQFIEKLALTRTMRDSITLSYINFNSALSNYISFNNKNDSDSESMEMRRTFLTGELEGYKEVLNTLTVKLSQEQRDVFSKLQTVSLLQVILNLLIFMLLFLTVQKPFLRHPKLLAEENEALSNQLSELQRELDSMKQKGKENGIILSELEKDLKIAKSSIYENVKARESLRKDLEFLALGLDKQIVRPLKSIINLVKWTRADAISKLSIDATKNQNLILSRADNVLEYTHRFKQYVSFTKSQGKLQRVNSQLLLSEIIYHLRLENVEIKIEGQPPVLIADKTNLQDVFQKVFQIITSNGNLNAIVITNRERVDLAQFEFIGTYAKGDNEKNFWGDLTKENGLDYMNELNVAIIKKKVHAVKGNFSLEQINNENLSITFTWPYEV